MENKHNDTDENDGVKQDRCEKESNPDSLEVHFQCTIRIIESWPAWKKGLVNDMKESFAIRKSENDEDVVVLNGGTGSNDSD